MPLERANLLLGIQLPIGSEEGLYLLQLIDAKDAPRIRASGDATIKDYVTTIEARLDLSALSPGRYTLRVQRQGALAVTSYPVEVR